MASAPGPGFAGSSGSPVRTPGRSRWRIPGRRRRAPCPAARKCAAARCGFRRLAAVSCRRASRSGRRRGPTPVRMSPRSTRRCAAAARPFARRLPAAAAPARRAGRVHLAGVPLRADRPDPGRGGARRDRRPQPAQLDAALRQLAGGLSGPILALRDRLLDLLAHLEANLDFVDEADVDPLGRAALAEELDGGRPSSGPRPSPGSPRPAGGRSPGRPGRPAQRRQEPAVQRTAPARPRDRLPQAGTTRDYLTALLRLRRADRRTGRHRRAWKQPTTPCRSRRREFRADQADEADLVLLCSSADNADERFPPSARPHQCSDPSGLDQMRSRVAARVEHQRCHPHQRGDRAWAWTNSAVRSPKPCMPASLTETFRQAPAARCRDSIARAADALGSASRTLHSAAVKSWSRSIFGWPSTSWARSWAAS